MSNMDIFISVEHKSCVRVKLWKFVLCSLKQCKCKNKYIYMILHGCAKQYIYMILCSLVKQCEKCDFGREGERIS